MSSRGLIRMNMYNRSALLRAPFSRPIVPRVARIHCAAEKSVSETQLQNAQDDGVRCVVNEEGHLVCERLDPGDYVVRSADVVSEEVEGSQTFCYITDDGQLMCEGLQSGEYTIEKATDDDIESMLAHVEALSKETPAVGEQAPAAAAVEEKAETLTEVPVSDNGEGEDGVRCFVTEEGHMVCERLPPGDYKVKSAPTADGAATKDSEEVVGSETFCYITDDGQLLCEGLQSGEYTIEEASDEDIESMLAHVESLAKDKPAVTAEVPAAVEEKVETVAEEVPESDNGEGEDGVRCFVTEEGHMVCERLPPGDYKVKTAPNDDGTVSKTSEEVVGEGTFCYITDDGQLICEGLPEGNYSIEEAGEEDMEAMLKHMKSLDSA
ncbi:hypothetical protein BSKO_02128 [Bryopsis sp. KO-2023]|nr:hypothetical protein BSKO_02128 [Bryopsis sp. KO-2023]